MPHLLRCTTSQAMVCALFLGVFGEERCEVFGFVGDVERVAIVETKIGATVLRCLMGPVKSLL